MLDRHLFQAYARGRLKFHNNTEDTAVEIPNQLFSFSVPTLPFQRQPELPPNGLIALKDDTGYHVYVYFSGTQAIRCLQDHVLEPNVRERCQWATERGRFADDPPEPIHITGAVAELFAAILWMPRILEKREVSLPAATFAEMQGRILVCLPRSGRKTAGVYFVDDHGPHIHIFYSRIQAQDILSRHQPKITKELWTRINGQIDTSGLTELSTEPAIEIVGLAAERIYKAGLVVYRILPHATDDTEEGFTFTV
jgi:hypothetical protein